MVDYMRSKGIDKDSIREYSLLVAIKRLMTYIRPYSAMALAALILSIVSSGLLVLRPYLIKIAIFVILNLFIRLSPCYNI